jgi:hypothetical protein
MADFNIISLKQPGLPAVCPNQVCKWRTRCVISEFREGTRPTFVPRAVVNFTDVSLPVWLTCKSFEREP